MRMLVDSFLPEGITEIAVDSIFMMPQLGVLSSIHPEAALEVFNRDCLVRLGTAINPIFKRRLKDIRIIIIRFWFINRGCMILI